MDRKKYIEEIKGKFAVSSIIREFDNLKNLKVLVIGDSILDEYIFTMPKGRAIKDPILSLDFVRKECYCGGILAIANHLAEFVSNLDVITILGDREHNREFIIEGLNKNINPKFFTKKDSPTTKKKRYIDHLRKGKLFKVEFINDEPIDKETENEIIAYLEEELPKYDLVVLGDFGHGFITPRIVDSLEKHSKFLAANVQTNSTNMGYNYITKYNKIDFLTSNESEIRLALSNRFGNFSEITDNLNEKTKFKNILLTTGKEGCVLIKNSTQYSGPSLTSNIVDVVGAGDTVFAITSLLSCSNTSEELIVFIANCVGALAVNIMGNKESVTKENLIKFIEELK